MLMEMNVKPLFIRAEWDAEASVWFVADSEVPGLATEADTLEDLVEKLKIMVPELLAANQSDAPCEVPFELMTRRFETARVNCH